MYRATDGTIEGSDSLQNKMQEEEDQIIDTQS